MTDNLEALSRALPRIWEGMVVTFQITLGGAPLAFIIAVLLGLMTLSDHVFVRGFSRTIIEFLRGTSLVVQLFFIFFVLPLPPFNITLPPIVVGVLALGLNYGAYGAEVVRGSINSVPAGQWEATTALSMSRVQRMRRVIFPQAWALMLPSLDNLLIQLLKGTAIVSFVTMFDLTASLNKLRIETGVFFAYSVGLVLYFLIALALTAVMRAMEIRAKHALGQGDSLKDTLKGKLRPSVRRSRSAL